MNGEMHAPESAPTLIRARPSLSIRDARSDGEIDTRRVVLNSALDLEIGFLLKYWKYIYIYMDCKHLLFVERNDRIILRGGMDKEDKG